MEIIKYNNRVSKWVIIDILSLSLSAKADVLFNQ